MYTDNNSNRGCSDSRTEVACVMIYGVVTLAGPTEDRSPQQVGDRYTMLQELGHKVYLVGIGKGIRVRGWGAERYRGKRKRGKGEAEAASQEREREKGTRSDCFDRKEAIGGGPTLPLRHGTQVTGQASKIITVCTNCFSFLHVSSKQSTCPCSERLFPTFIAVPCVSRLRKQPQKPNQQRVFSSK